MGLLKKILKVQWSGVGVAGWHDVNIRKKFQARTLTCIRIVNEKEAFGKGIGRGVWKTKVHFVMNDKINGEKQKLN